MKRTLFTLTAVMSLAAMAGGLSGCSSDSASRSAVVADQIETAKQQQEFKQQQLEAKQEKAKGRLEIVPEWVVNPPESTPDSIYAVGIGTSSDLATSISISKMKAQFELAQMFKQELSGSERSYLQDNGGDSVVIQYTALIDRIIDRVPLRGFKIAKQKVTPIDGKFNTFILMKLPVSEIKKVIDQQRTQSKTEAVKKAFDDLEQRLNRRRLQQQQESMIEPLAPFGDSQTIPLHQAGYVESKTAASTL